MLIYIEEVPQSYSPHYYLSHHRYFVQVAPLSVTAYNTSQAFLRTLVTQGHSHIHCGGCWTYRRTLQRKEDSPQKTNR